MEFSDLEREIELLITRLGLPDIAYQEHIKSEAFLRVINQSSYLITLHDVEFYRPLCLNDNMRDFYGFTDNRLSGSDYLYYLKTIHTSTYSALLESISFFRKNNPGYLNLTYKLLYQNKEWKNVLGCTKTIYRIGDNKPKFALSLAVEDQTRNIINGHNNIEQLTNREKAIADLLCQGYTKKEVAEQLFISKHTVHTHTKNIYRKLDINKISELIVLKEKYNL